MATVPAERLSGPAGRLLWAGLTVAMAGSLTGVFVSLFLYISGGRILAMALYNLGVYVGIAVMSVWAAGQRHGVGPRRLLAVGVALTAAQYVVLLALGAYADRVVLPLGLLAGVAGGVYWFAMNTLRYDLVGPRERFLYYGTSQALTAAAGVALPLVGGLVISRLRHGLGYHVVFAAALVAYLTALVVVRGLPEGHAVGGLPVGDALRLARERPRFRRLALALGIEGLRDVTGGFVLVALTYLATRSAGGLALYTAAAALAGALGALLLRRVRDERARAAMWLGASVSAAASLVMVPWGPALGLFTAFQVVTAFSAPLYRIPIATRLLAVMDEDPAAARTRGSYVLGQEIAIAGGRLVAVGAMLALVALLPLWTALALGTAAVALAQVGAVALAASTTVHSAGSPAGAVGAHGG